jgi:glycerophosphoryl diester phosphodiesterase
MEIWGHRGAYDNAPENTLTGFQMAADMGADGVELDIQLTKDGEVVVIHDETVDRTSDGFGYVKDFTLSEIKKLNFNKRGITPPGFMEIPTLAEVLELLKPTMLKINIELKTGIIYYNNIEAMALNIAAEHGMMERIVWSSFNHYSVQRLKQLKPEAETALLCSGGILVTGEQCEKTGASALHPNIRQLTYPGLVEDCHQRGVKVRVWTVNEPEELKLALGLNVDAVCTNKINYAKETVDALLKNP